MNDLVNDKPQLVNELVNVGVYINNMLYPLPTENGYIVAKVYNGEIWYYGFYEDENRACLARSEVNGVIFSYKGGTE